MYRYFITKICIFCCNFILKTVHILVFVQKSRRVLKYLFSCVPSTVPYCIVYHVKLAVSSGIFGQWDETGYVVLLKQCCILISNLPSGFVFNQKGELPSICKLYKLIFFFFQKRWTKGLGCLIFHFLHLMQGSLKCSVKTVPTLKMCAICVIK